MAKFLGVDMPKLIKRHLGKKVLPATLAKRTTGTPTIGNLTNGTNDTFTNYTCRGWVDEWPGNYPTGKSFFREDGPQGEFAENFKNAVRQDEMVVLIAAYLPSGIAPSSGDKVTIKGRTFFVVSVGHDPSDAIYKLQVRGA